jgi:hypothetical protein
MRPKAACTIRDAIAATTAETIVRIASVQNTMPGR